MPQRLDLPHPVYRGRLQLRPVRLSGHALHGHPGSAVMFRGEYVAQVDPDLCVGCRDCLRLCQFGALAYSAANREGRS